MNILQRESKIIIASHNQGKINEIADLLIAYKINVLSAKDFKLPEPKETGKTFAENALLKACFVAETTNHVALSDDSGLCVEALDGAPGIFSARWAQPGHITKPINMEATNRTGIVSVAEPASAIKTAGDKNFTKACKKIWQELQNKKTQNYKATFVCVLALAFPSGITKTFEGKIHGKITWPPKGKNGFGYDPIFVPEGFQKTFGEMLPKEKHKISHRTNAFALLIKEK